VISGSYRVTGLELGPVVRGKINYAIVTFSEPIDGTAPSLATTDFTLTGPSGSVGITSAALLSATQALVGFSSYASGAGTYTFTVATTIKRLSDGANLGSGYTTEFYRAEGPVTTYQYDDANLLANEIDGLGGRTTSFYDVRGDLVAESDALGRTTRHQYDMRRLLTRTILPDPDWSGVLAAPDTEYQYDDAGDLQTMVDSLGGTTDYAYDARHRLLEVLEPDQDGGSPYPRLQTLYAYTAAGELSMMTDPVGRRHTKIYDWVGRLQQEAVLGASWNDFTLDDDTGGDTIFNTPLGSWTAQSGSAGYGNDWRYAAGAGSETATATWSFTGLAANKSYEVFVTWAPDITNNATNAPFTVYDGTTGGTSLGSTGVDQ
jgi:YD repeat-containing protein